MRKRFISGYVSRPIETCPTCGETEKIRAYKVYDDRGVWSQCMPCRDNTLETQGWFLEPEVEATI